MQFGVAVNQKQTLQVNLSPELRQSINILQYSSIELVEFLHQQELDNPLLIVKENSQNDFTAQSYKSIDKFNRDKDYNPINHCYSKIEKLEEHLLEQIITIPNITSLQKDILKFLIRNLNENGFLEMDSAIIAHILSVPIDDVEKTVNILQTFEPIGVGARNLKECLLLQMHFQLHSNQLTYHIIENHLEDLAAKRYQKIAKMYNVTVHEVQESADYIKSLNPRPCNNFYHEVTHYIIPDVIIENINNKHMIIVNDRFLPTISINECYKNSLDHNDSEEASKYLKEKYNEVMILMNGLAKRKLTLYKVTKAIIEKQKEFLQHGMSGLKPMTLSDIAEELNFHESTISRATSNKYIQTKHGLFNLKNLFTKGINRVGELETKSSASIKEQIKKMIDEEDKGKPLSDQEIVKQLEQNGVLISRRTVAKYREEIGIPSSSKRKRF